MTKKFQFSPVIFALVPVCIKGTSDVISSDNVTLYPKHLYLANNVEYIVVFLPLKDDAGNLAFILDKATLLRPGTILNRTFFINKMSLSFTVTMP